MIKEFQDEFRWLSNFWLVDIKYKDKIFMSVEHAYMAQKNTSDVWQSFCIKEADPKIIKNLSYEIKLRSDWEREKVDIMEEILYIKFQNLELRQKLIETKNELLEEGNDWGDTFWGVDLDTGNGENILGKLIMKIRDEIKYES